MARRWQSDRRHARAWSAYPPEQYRLWQNTANTRLLGDAITLTETAWHQPSLLPGWSRAHVVTHLARDADAYRQLLRNPALGFDLGSDEERFRALESGADRNALSLLEDLDNAMGRLADAAADVTDWNRPVRIFTETYPLSFVSALRLHETLIHHLDLKVGFNPDAINETAAALLLHLAIHLRRKSATPTIHIQSTSGIDETLGRGDPIATVTGLDARLWAWLSGRLSPTHISGAAGLELDLLTID
ncbi:MAG: maleylpyruvate isomerase family mycothiol-dependent enzyme [Propionibacteriaceae bacterium]|jgi:maleylpyruvate isomerase|nr:maleylpyruvate isomerase family mycothiol-dependent enzyme [Propionibacteriaceae bacterium]